jgi:1-acyl-sn-glycerol-3-phosphate acyltransferase
MRPDGNVYNDNRGNGIRERFESKPMRLETSEVLSAAALSALILGLLGLLVLFAIQVRRFPLNAVQTFWYDVNVLVAKLFWRAKISGPLPIPPDRGAVIVCNHRAPIDPCFIGLATRRVIRWMVAEEYFRQRAFGWFLRMAEAIPTRRGGVQTAATKAAIDYARQGGLVGVFPEGRINRSDALLLPGRSGAVMIALKARVPILPCFVRGSRFNRSIGASIFQRAKVDLFVGEPIDLSEYYGREGEREVLEALTGRILKEIARLAGHPDFEPEVAGRFSKSNGGGPAIPSAATTPEEATPASPHPPGRAE